jgi:hypothetical protein
LFYPVGEKVGSYREIGKKKRKFPLNEANLEIAEAEIDRNVVRVGQTLRKWNADSAFFEYALKIEL